MALNITKIAFGCTSAQDLRERLESHADEGEVRLTTRNRPTRFAEMAGGSLYWIHAHIIIGRSPILGFEQRDDGKWWIRLEPRLIPVLPLPRRAHQGWRYLAADDAPTDFDGASVPGAEPMPGRLVSELAKLGLV